MTIQELYDSLPAELRVTPERMPPEIREAVEYLTARNEMLDAGTPVVTIDEWRASRG